MSADTIEEKELSPADLVEIRNRHGMWTESQREATYDADLLALDRQYDEAGCRDYDTPESFDWMSRGGESDGDDEPDSVGGGLLDDERANFEGVFVPLSIHIGTPAPDVLPDDPEVAAALRRQGQFDASLDDVEEDSGGDGLVGRAQVLAANRPPVNEPIFWSDVNLQPEDFESVDDTPTQN